MLASIVLVLTALTLTVFVLCASMSAVFNKPNLPLIDQLNDVLPQTQCGECGYPGCKPYAQAILQGEAINKCLPGGNATIAALSLLANQPVIALDGIAIPKRVAYIREAECIGCTKCIQACPVDAILGAAKQMHTVITNECTGCDLCVDPCPVDCIDMLPTDDVFNKMIAKQRFETRMNRLNTEHQQRKQRQEERLKQQALLVNSTDDKAALIAAAIARTEAKKAARLPNPNSNLDNEK